VPWRTADRYRSTFEEAPVGLVLLDDDGWIVDANRRIEELLEHPHRITGHKLAEFCTAEFELLGDPEPEPEQHGQIRLESDIDGETALEYTAVNNVVPGQHLVVVQEASR